MSHNLQRLVVIPKPSDFSYNNLIKLVNNPIISMVLKETHT